MAGFDELANVLDKLYSEKYTDRERAMRGFGHENEPDLRRIMESDSTLVELVESARIGDKWYFAGFIREGMGIAVHIRENSATMSARN